MDILWLIVVLLLAFWLLGYSLSLGGGLIDLLLVLAVIIIIIRLITGIGL